jgi:periplasmic divalent cation tolerance protein
MRSPRRRTEPDVRDDTGVRVVLVTSPDVDAARRLVRTLVEESLAACGNIVPGVESIYRWRGEVREDAEVLIVLKTTAACAARVVARIPELHPYEVPEVLVMPVMAGHQPYLDWVVASASREADR